MECEEIERSKQRGSPSQDPSDDNPFRPPLNLHSAWNKVDNLDEKLIFKPKMSSIVISTNAFGDFSKCTVVTELIGDERMGCIVEEARKLSLMFIHQPQTARCLIFLLLLGNICQKITEHYGKAITTLTSVLKSNVG